MTLAVAFVAVLLASWAVVELAEELVAARWVVQVDQAVARWVLARRTEGLTAFMRAVTSLGSNVVLVPVLVLAGALVWRARGRLRPVLLLLATWLGAVALWWSVKALVGRVRPGEWLAVAMEGGLAFPSGHATQSLAVYGALAFLLGRRARRRWQRAAAWIGAAVLALVVGASRVYLGVHWLSDVCAGFALGAVWLAVVLLAFARIDQPSGSQPAG